LRRSAVRATLTIQIPRQSARPKLSKQKTRPYRAERIAQVDLRYQEIELPPPSEHRDKAPVKVWVVHLREETPPAGETPLEWFLLTTMAVTSDQIAEECIRWYRRRWRIGVSGEGHITQSVEVRPRSKDSDLVAWEAPWRESKTVEPSDPYTLGVTATHQVVTYSERRCSLVTRFSGG
jgi:hypothetical protein